MQISIIPYKNRFFKEIGNISLAHFGPHGICTKVMANEATERLLEQLHQCYAKKQSGTFSFSCNGDGVALSLNAGDIVTARGFHFDQGGDFDDLLYGDISKIAFHQGVDNSPGHDVSAPMELILYQLTVGKDMNLAQSIDDVRKTGVLPPQMLNQLSEEADQVETIDEQIFVLHEGVTTIGRAAECDLVENDKTVSRRHAEIHIQDGSAKLLDLGSANGICINRESATDAVIKDGNLISIGNTVYRFFWAEKKVGVLFKMKGSAAEIEDRPTLMIPS